MLSDAQRGVGGLAGIDTGSEVVFRHGEQMKNPSDRAWSPRRRHRFRSDVAVRMTHIVGGLDHMDGNEDQGHAKPGMNNLNRPAGMGGYGRSKGKADKADRHKDASDRPGELP
jgi:hypothetical protein